MITAVTRHVITLLLAALLGTLPSLPALAAGGASDVSRTIQDAARIADEAAAEVERQQTVIAIVEKLMRHPRDRKLFARMIALQRQSRDWEPLLGSYQWAVKVFPRDVPFWQGLAETAEAVNRPQIAMAARMKVLELQPSQALLWGGQGIGLFKQDSRPPDRRKP